LYGGEGNDVLWAGAGGDVQFGGQGSDVLHALANDDQRDVMDCAPGLDVAAPNGASIAYAPRVCAPS
jgi:Ca2+-binding RTX toxin-like protein